MQGHRAAGCQVSSREHPPVRNLSLVGAVANAARVFRRFSDEFKDARFYKLDVDEVPEVAQELAVRAMPTFLLFKNGEKVGEVVGANPAALKTAIQQNV